MEHKSGDEKTWTKLETYFKGAQVLDFDHSDFHDFYTIKSLWEGDFGVKNFFCYKNI